VCRTCGRTESPEWRKVRIIVYSRGCTLTNCLHWQGPDGPKSLCNACGLRWAKQTRKYDDSNEVAGDVETAALF
jgi:ribosomal protein L37E